MNRSIASLPYRPALDGIRALAVLGVFFYHLQFPWALGGYLGVETFFVLSGYLITSLLLHEYHLHGRLDLKRFWLRRARRLWPALWTLLLGVSVLGRFLIPEALPRLKHDLPAALFYYTNWLYIWQHVPYFERYARPPLLQHLWSLAVEEQFYLFWPLLLWGLLRLFARPGRRRTRWAVLLVLGGVAASLGYMAWIMHTSGDTARAYYGTDTRAAGFLLGGALALGWPLGRVQPHSPRVARLFSGLGLLGLGGTLWVYARLHEFTPWLYPWGFALTALNTALLILPSTLPEGWWSQFLGQPLIRWIGTRSYAIYLWHWPLVAMFRPGAECRWPPLVCAAGHLALTFALAEWSYRVIETPIRRGGFLFWWRTLPRQAGRLIGFPLLLLGVGIFTAWRPWETPPTASVAPTLAPTPSWAQATLKPPSPSPTSSKEGYATLLPLSPPTASPPPGPKTSLTPPLTPTVTPSATPSWPCYATLIGDSVMARTYSTWMAHTGPKDHFYFYMDAKASRMPTEVPDLIQPLRQEGHLYHNVVLHIGTNALVNEGVFDAIISQLIRFGVRKIYLINIRRPVGWEGIMNERLARVAERWPQVILIDWHAASEGHPEWFLDDGVHLTAQGAQAYVNIALQAMKQHGCAP